MEIQIQPFTIVGLILNNINTLQIAMKWKSWAQSEKKCLGNSALTGKLREGSKLIMGCMSMCISVLFPYMTIFHAAVFELSVTSLTPTALLYIRRCFKPTFSHTFSCSLNLPFSHSVWKTGKKVRPKRFCRGMLHTSMFKSYSPINLSWIYQMQANWLVSLFPKGT